MIQPFFLTILNQPSFCLEKDQVKNSLAEFIALSSPTKKMTEEKTTTASVIFDVAWKELEAQNQTLFPLDEEGEILTSVKDLKTSVI